MDTNFSKSCYIIAEIGLNHNGDYTLAKDSVIAAAKAGANAVKFQNFVTEDFLSDKSILHTYKNCDKEVTEPLFDICKKSEFKKEWFPDLLKLCKDLDVDFLSTPTSESGVDDLIAYDIKYIKNGSDYLSHIPLLKYMASTNATIIISTGMAYQDEIDDAVDAILEIRPDKSKLVIMHCTSSYPTYVEDTNLRKIQTLIERYNVSVGFSDHTEGWIAAVQSVTLGVKMIEKHFTLDKNLPGPDHWFSSNPEDFKELVDQIRLAENRMGIKELRPAQSEMKVLNQWRLGLVWDRNITAGSCIMPKDIAIRKPATGLRPKELDSIIGCQTVRSCKKGESVFDTDYVAY
ncbi:N-acetylneuraminate synthase [bacterium]|jgi:N,N'-diacetyllegionaminate synthase|nr:N-acetylneuraminate synthase [bacterium]